MKELKEAETKITAADIKKSLSKRHENDFYLTEVKTGPTWFNTFYRIDAMAMARSWANPKITMYEVKVNRGDFLKDQKYQKYFTYCHEFYFACTPDLIQRDEIDATAGLIYSTGKSNRIIKKALYRDQEIPCQIFQYIIMNRITESPHPFFNDKIEYYQAWLERKKDSRELSCKVKSEIIKRLADLEGFKENYENIKKGQDELIEVFKEYGEWTFGNDLVSTLRRLLKQQQIVNFDPSRFNRQLINCIESLTEIQKGLVGEEVKAS